eukprot:TRINITY_DN2716_c0_g1_i1.p1 TRINITY_DN2716_c0_g1~~TRINITY_DN2716_c0_g1_i1.p1  ORF type:complete len:175 (-),score=26.78 TRINITY_DN2716_c0_g1_i1:274-798(-)
MMRYRSTIGLILASLLLSQQVAANPLSVSRILERSNQISSSLKSSEGRSDEDFGLQSVFQLGIKLLPIFLNLLTGGSQSSSDRIEDIDLKQEDPLSWQNFLSMGLKVLLAIFGSSSDGIDKSDTTPTQAIIGTVISALTGSDDPQEVATMAKQADEVLNLVMTLVEALKTSFSS